MYMNQDLSETLPSLTNEIDKTLGLMTELLLMVLILDYQKPNINKDTGARLETCYQLFNVNVMLMACSRRACRKY